MSTKSTPSPESTPPVWARLSVVDPPLKNKDKSLESGPGATVSTAGNTSEVTNLKDGKMIHHIVKSHDFPDGNLFAINSETFNIGRANSCHLTVRYNKLVSGTHCRIHRDEDGYTWLEDTSTNGTLVNKTRKVLKEKVKLTNGDIIHLVFKNSVTAENLGFRIELFDSDEEATQKYEDDTLPEEIGTPQKSIVQEKPSGSKRGASPSFDESLVAKKKIHLEPENEDDEIGESLVCIICQDIFHDCVSLQPCMHSFCAGCYSEWMATSNECPCCRLKVDRISKNHLVNNLVESYLKKNPQKKRTEAEIQDLDAKNKITHDMLYKRKLSSQSHGSSSPGSGSQSSGSVSPTPPMPTFVNFNPAFGRNMATFGAPRTVCRQCPENAARTLSNASSCASACGGTVATPAAACSGTAATPAAACGTVATPAAACGTVATPAAACGTAATPAAGDGIAPNAGDGPGPSTAAAATADADPDAKTNPQAPDYVCGPGQNHVLCMCCLQPMPDRRADRTRDQTVPKQQCTICYRFYCHAYWTCPKADCLGCLGKFREMNFGRKCLSSILLENQYESDALRDYLDNKGISVRQLLDSCITKLEAREYNTTDSNRGALNPDTVICYPCGLRNFQELVYFYRKDIADADLPGAVTSRDDCYWGKGCRTQKHKPHHAAKLNHICDASRNRP